LPPDSASPSRSGDFNDDAPGPVHLVDADDAASHALQSMVESAGLQACAHPSPEQFLAACDEHIRGCVVTALEMPGMNGLQLQQALHDRHIYLPVVFLTGSGDIRHAVQALRQGAVDFIEKPPPPDLLLSCIREALQMDVQRRAQERAVVEIRTRLATLSKREREVLEKVVDGQHTKQIALDLGISSKTVDSHRSRIMSKMGANSLPDLFARVFALRRVDASSPGRM
jgi:two-component system response regulator FixJ